ncbi:hypothetical protein [Flavonifractor sp. An10]|uniref:hypothetical protein n=1 Tax=Flavonifractor sp. An10 TaxID=1965537 RepID=UPI001140F948
MKKILALSLAAAMTLGLAACGGGTTTAESSTRPPARPPRHQCPSAEVSNARSPGLVQPPALQQLHR